MDRTLPARQDCVEDCLRCYRSCLETMMTHCLEHGDAHVEPAHVRLMMSCAEICRTAAHLMLMRSAHESQLCRQCAEICEECAAECERLGGMEDCAEQCRRCARSCRAMAG